MESDDAGSGTSAPARRAPPLDQALWALAADAEAFGVLEWGGSTPLHLQAKTPIATQPSPAVQPPPAAAAVVATSLEATHAGQDSLERIAADAAACRRCPLGSRRTHAVPGQGNPAAEIMFVGEAPGADEDAQGLAFVGAAGQLLTKMIGAMGFSRDDVFIANVLKCRPPDNRAPQPDEAAACTPFLERQIRLIRPKVLCLLGSHAAHNVLRTEETVGRMRLRVHSAFGAQAVVTYHPAYLLRYPGEKKKSWEDLRLVLRILGRTPPSPPGAPQVS